MALTSAGDILINAVEFVNQTSVDAVVKYAKGSGLEVFIGVLVPPKLRKQFTRDIDDAAADVAGRIGGKLTASVAASASVREAVGEDSARRGPHGGHRRHPRSRPRLPS
jgi:hypothetical protein